MEHKNIYKKWRENERGKKSRGKRKYVVCCLCCAWKVRWNAAFFVCLRRALACFRLYSKHITYVSLAAINVCILWTGGSFFYRIALHSCLLYICLYVGELYTLSQLLSWFRLDSGCFGQQIEVFKSSMQKYLPLAILSSFFLGFSFVIWFFSFFFSLSLPACHHTVYQYTVLHLCMVWCDSYRSKMILAFFSVWHGKLFIWTSHWRLSYNRLFEWRQHKRAE